MATKPNVVCAFAFIFLLSCVGLSQQRTISGDESSFLMQQQARLFRPPALLADLQVLEGQLQPPFTSNNFNYTVIIPEDVHDLHIRAKLVLGKETDRYRVRITASDVEADMYGSVMVLKRNLPTICVTVHVSSHKLQTSAYSLNVLPGPHDVPSSHVDDHPASGPDKKLLFCEALLNTLMIFGAALALSSGIVLLYGRLATLRSRSTMGVEGYQPISGRPEGVVLLD